MFFGVCSGSIVFSQACLSQYLRSIRYLVLLSPKNVISAYYRANIQRRNNVVTTSLDVVTLQRRCNDAFLRRCVFSGYIFSGGKIKMSEHPTHLSHMFHKYLPELEFSRGTKLTLSVLEKKRILNNQQVTYCCQQ